VGRKVLSLVGVLVAAAVCSSSALAAKPVAKPVPSLAPAATQKLWRKVVARPHVRAFSATCAVDRAVFYAGTDWLRLATKLAANQSACTQYYVSVPPVVADKATFRSDQAWRIRALGPNFHTLAEINVTGWTSWVSTTGGTWYAAGVEARRRMHAAGYDVTLGDTWVVNELSSAVRVGNANARRNMQSFVKGLYDGDGTLPATRGAVFVSGMSQATGELSVYQSRLQDWYEDASFWSDMQAYVSDWSQELYGDIRNYAVAGAPRDARLASLNEYLQHQVALARVAPASATAAQAFLAAAYNPLANAAWQYDAAFGWTNVPYDLMQDYVSAQTAALRAAGGSRFGFAWAPKNLAALPTADYTAQTDALLGRLAASIADADPCGDTWCGGELAGAAFNGGWQTFAAWKPSRLDFTTAAQTLPAGAVSQPLTVELRTSTGLAYTAGAALPVTATTSSPGGAFALSAAGPWTATLATTVASGATTVAFYYRDTQPGTPVVSVSAAGKTAAAQAATVTAAADTTPPETAIASAPSGTVASTSASFAFTSEPGARYECTLDGASFSACASPTTYASLAQGAHTLEVRAVDAAGNADASPARAAWTVDTVAPNTTLTQWSRPNASSATFWFVASEAASFQCALDAGTFAACTSPKAYTGLARGTHTIQVRAIDAAGNTDASPAAFSWRI
jgi:hypothetical protein